jgi:23S rRNA (cytosine1962-C5)-methyltransferase
MKHKPTQSPGQQTVTALRLNRDLTRSIKRGNPWIYLDALRPHSPLGHGTICTILDNKLGRPLATGYYTLDSPLAIRVCSTDPDLLLDWSWLERMLEQARALRERLFNSETTGYRLVNGEGDGLPGLVIDRYGTAAVMKLDGPGAEAFYPALEIAKWLAQVMGIETVVLRSRDRDVSPIVLVGEEPQVPVPFLEHGTQFAADILVGQKTGFFLDQRENRRLIGQLSKEARVLNLFGYTGGFSIAAGRGGATSAVTVDIAPQAVAMAQTNWELNRLTPEAHEGAAQDVFEFLDQSLTTKRRWDIVVADPPSFAPSASKIPQATAAYKKLFCAAAQVTRRGGLLAASSCSSHIGEPAFIEICEEAVSMAKRKGTVIAVQGQPADHPFPLALPEFRYLKFVLLRVE